MNKNYSAREVFKMAINKEIESQALYLGLSQIMNNQTAKEAFVELAQQEQRHRILLERYSKGELKQGALGIKDIVDLKMAEYVDQPLISTDMELKGEVKKLLEELATEELMHKQRVERIYTDVGFPQTDGG